MASGVSLNFTDHGADWGKAVRLKLGLATI